jgi:cytochrome oxidase assembly protein ShyY1
VVVSGHYDATHQLVVLYRTRDGAPGVDVVVPLVTSSGAAVLVDRGWVQTSANGNEPVDVPTPPAGTVTVTGWLRLDASDTGDRVTPSSGSVRSISSVAIGQTLPYSLYRGFLELTDEQPRISPSPKLAAPPDLSAGPSYFYGVQWWFFGILAFGFFGYFGYAERTQPKTTPQATSPSTSLPRSATSEAAGVPAVDREHHTGDVRRGG